MLLLLAAFFAGSETALMSLNRYRLRHRAKAGNRGARLAEALLAHPDRLIGLILLLSTIVNVVDARRWSASSRFAWAAIIWSRSASSTLTFVILIFCEVAPKTFGALHPERLALPAAYVYTPLLWVLYPFVWATNLLANGVLRLLGVSQQQASHSLSSEELRTVVAEAGAMIPHRHQQMLVSILDLEKATVEDIMVPRTEIVGIDVDDAWDKIRRATAPEPAHALAGIRRRHRPHHRRAAHEARGARARARPPGSRGADRGGERARCLLRPLGHARSTRSC